MLLIILWLSLLVSCAGPAPVPIEIHVEPGLEDLWHSLTAAGGAPSGLSEGPAVSSAPGAPKVLLFRRFFYERKAEPAAAAARKADPAEVREKAVALRPYAPAVYFLDSRRDMASEELIRGDCTGNPGFTVKPLDEIHLPEKALRVDGIFPGEPGYALMRETILRIETPAQGGQDRDSRRRKEAADALFVWMESLPPTDPPRVVRIGAVGDLMPARGVDAVLLGSEKGVERVFGTTLSVLLEQDLLLGNIEGAITRRTAKTPKAYNFRFSPEILRPLKKAGFGYLAPANNHIYDYGEEGLLDTLDALKAAGMPASGIGRNWEEASRPWEGGVGPLTVRVMSLAVYPREGSGFDGKISAAAGKEKPGILWADDAALRAMEKYFSPETFDIVMVHGGEEWRNTPSPAQTALYRSFVDAGADAVFGSHPHVLQAVEPYAKGFIAYSLGNFIFPGMDETRYGEESLILSLGIYEGVVRYAEFFPVLIDGRFVRLDDTDKIIRRFTALTRRFLEKP
jgi:poly-gamma-glutamate synthesis protein (capsule biosynthesis protein)